MTALLITDLSLPFIWEGCMVLAISRVYWSPLKEKLYFKDIEPKSDLKAHLYLLHVIFHD